MKSLVSVAMILCGITILHAQESTSDWRLIGGTSDSYTFYDANSVRKLPDGHFEVWLKGLPMTATNKAANKALDKDHVDRAAKKIASGYVPPAALDHKLTHDEIINAVGAEGIANDASIEPTTRLLVEVDCPNRMTRFLSIRVHLNGQTQSSDQPGEWQHTAPETNMSRLHLALCR
jgi:hypothetical protein